VTSVAQTILRRMPPGTTPPFIVRYNASSVPILQMSLSSDRHSESELYDYGIYRVRQQLAVVQGTTFPLPYGGMARQVTVDLDPEKLRAYNIAPPGRQRRRQRAESHAPDWDGEDRRSRNIPSA
jgi:multidrug efflux pump subunit AcrB